MSDEKILAAYEWQRELYFAYRAVPEHKIKARRAAHIAWLGAHAEMRTHGGTSEKIRQLLQDKVNQSLYDRTHPRRRERS